MQDNERAERAKRLTEAQGRGAFEKEFRKIFPKSRAMMSDPGPGRAGKVPRRVQEMVGLMQRESNRRGR